MPHFFFSVPEFPPHLFLRHGKLDLPYRDHADMPRHVIVDLASGRLNPQIDQPFTEALIRARLGTGTWSGPVKIFTSPSQRTQETGRIVERILREQGVDVIFVGVLQELAESGFNANALLSLEEPVDMAALNRRVLEGMVTGQHAEPLLGIWDRVTRLFARLEADPSPCICITHDFIMRVIELAIRNGMNADPGMFTAEDLFTTQRNTYLYGFGADQSFKHFYSGQELFKAG